MKAIAYLGPEGSFSQQAALKQLEALPGDPGCLQPYPTIAAILTAVDRGEASLGIVPAENSIEGSVNITLDLLANELNLYIQKEIILAITHHLLSYTPSLVQIHTVLSHPQALAQCRHFLQEKLPQAELMETSSTSEAVRRLDPAVPGIAAVASWHSHLCYQVPVVAENIGDFSPNQTRFLAVAKEPDLRQNTTKTSLIISMEKDRPGSLYEALAAFAKENINLTRIESRPAKKELGNYIFFIDCQAGYDHPGLQRALTALAPRTSIKNLGSYGELT
ncbi:MAG: prephenate dehydratase [Clostridia bacterium]|jgi:prephenate dehydratase|nr:prephenate dehydratase [Clostridia bacterium]